MAGNGNGYVNTTETPSHLGQLENEMKCISYIPSKSKEYRSCSLLVNNMFVKRWLICTENTYPVGAQVNK